MSDESVRKLMPHASRLMPVKAAVLADLQARIRACRLCQDAGYIAEARPTVSGRASDPVRIIGQAPGALTHARGYPFAGPSGPMLDTWLQRAGFPPGFLRVGCYLASLTRCFPGSSRSGSGDRPPSPAERRLCRPFLDEELALLRPRLVWLVGKLAIAAFMGPSRLDDVVGATFERDGAVWVPLPHPSGVSRWLNLPANRVRVEQVLDGLRPLAAEILATWELAGGEGLPEAAP